MNSDFTNLFNEWKKKDKHNGTIFISDGIINEEEWKKVSDGKKILYIFREAYSGDSDWNLAEELNDSGPWGQIWHRIVEWTYGIFNTDETHICRFSQSKIDYSKPNQWLRKVAVMNIKKSNGKPSSDLQDISDYANYDAKEILREIELINPSIIICGGTFDDINRISGNRMKNDKPCDNWFYWSNAINNKEILYIDFYHPSVPSWPNLFFYYAITNIYQQALLAKK